AEALGTTDLNGGALFNAEFGIRHRGSTVPERSGVALSFCRRLAIRMAPCFQSCFSCGCIKPNEKQAVDVKRLTKARSII
ncbi:hypothetical protein, partial [Pseudomonas helleri]|uniref:hypothetical protein n=1 Tax=Pseudomonas helleri TaxID=1608996 RepID=UPI0019D32681